MRTCRTRGNGATLVKAKLPVASCGQPRISAPKTAALDLRLRASGRRRLKYLPFDLFLVFVPVRYIVLFRSIRFGSVPFGSVLFPL